MQSLDASNSWVKQTRAYMDHRDRNTEPAWSQKQNNILFVQQKSIFFVFLLRTRVAQNLTKKLPQTLATEAVRGTSKGNTDQIPNLFISKLPDGTEMHKIVAFGARGNHNLLPQLNWGRTQSTPPSVQLPTQWSHGKEIKLSHWGGSLTFVAVAIWSLRTLHKGPWAKKHEDFFCSRFGAAWGFTAAKPNQSRTLYHEFGCPKGCWGLCLTVLEGKASWAITTLKSKHWGENRHLLAKFNFSSSCVMFCFNTLGEKNPSRTEQLLSEWFLEGLRACHEKLCNCQHVDHMLQLASALLEHFSMVRHVWSCLRAGFLLQGDATQIFGRKSLICSGLLGGSWPRLHCWAETCLWALGVLQKRTANVLRHRFALKQPQTDVICRIVMRNRANQSIGKSLRLQHTCG